MRYIACFDTDYPMTEEAMCDCLAVACGDQFKVNFVTTADGEADPELEAMAMNALYKAAIEVGMEEGIVNKNYSIHEQVINS